MEQTARHSFTKEAHKAWSEAMKGSHLIRDLHASNASQIMFVARRLLSCSFLYDFLPM